jgi:hypothetical protein
MTIANFEWIWSRITGWNDESARKHEKPDARRSRRGHVLRRAIYAADALEGRILLASITGNNTADAAYSVADRPATSCITISGAPAAAAITSVVVQWNVDSNALVDLDYYVENFLKWNSSPNFDMTTTGNDLDDNFAETSAKSRSFFPPSTTPVNGLWC